MTEVTRLALRDLYAFLTGIAFLVAAVRSFLRIVRLVSKPHDTKARPGGFFWGAAGFIGVCLALSVLVLGWMLFHQ